MSIASERNRQWAQGLALTMMEHLHNAPDAIALRAAELLMGMVEQRWKSRDKKGSSRTGMGMD
jgi:hypothetical protein